MDKLQKMKQDRDFYLEMQKVDAGLLQRIQDRIAHNSMRIRDLDLLILKEASKGE